MCYLTGISDVDALRHDLSFERFMNPMRDEPPDVDIDVESARREDVYDMILSRHGDERAACVAMIDTYRARSAVREVGKALGLPEVEVGVVAKAFPTSRRGTSARRSSELPELQGLNLPMRQLDLLFRVAERLDGFPRHIALHPCGIVLASHDLVERVPLERSAERPPDDPGGQGRRRAARLPEARRPGRADALVDAPRARRDRPDHRREGRPRRDRRWTTSRPSS